MEQPDLQSLPTVSLYLSAAAQRELEQRKQPLVVHMELLFSCMIRKQVYFPDVQHPDAFSLDCGHSNLQLGFRAIGTQSCLISEQAVPEHQTFPLIRVLPFMPKWLRLDFKNGQWVGEFGYAPRQ